MATLKIETIHGNFIWLTDVTRVGTLVHCYAETGDTAWESLQQAIVDLPSENLREQVKHEMTLFQCFDEAVLENSLVKGHFVFVKVMFKNESPQFWLLHYGKNYLMDDGKTVDRI